jgi:hypothetical protein
MHRQGFDLQLTQYDERGWRATFYTTGMEHSATSATGAAWERTPWHGTRRAAWDALQPQKGTEDIKGLAAAKARAAVQSRMMRSVAASGLLLLVLGVCSAAAQERIVVQGVVQWVAGTRLVMVADTGVSLRIDLMRADQRSYTGLQAGDRIVVVGTVAPERDRLLAESITSGAGTIPMDSWRMFPQSP